jgi:hypothetical protein
VLSTRLRSRHTQGGIVLRRPKAWHERDRRERGIAMVWMAITLITMVVFAGFAVDVSNWYLQAEKLQRGADAAAHAGVIFLPNDMPNATTTARSAATKNGYTDGGSLNTELTITQEANPNRLRVKIAQDVPTYFLGLIGIDDVRLSRQAVAEYVAPIPMGSPENRLGNDPEIGYSPAIWSMVGGPASIKEWGDRYQAKTCNSGNSGCTGTTNDDYAENGYLYAIEVTSPPAGQDLKIQIFDPAFVNVHSGCDNNMMSTTQMNNLKTLNPSYYGDAATRYASGATSAYCTGDMEHEGADVNTSFTVRAPNDTDYNDLDNPIIDDPTNGPCQPQTFKAYNPTSASYLYNNLSSGAESVVDGKAPWTLAETFRRWVTICTIPAANVKPGKYILQVRTNATASAPTVYNPSVDTGGHNRYSMRAGFGSAGLTSVDGTNVTISARGRLPVYANSPDSTADFYLARVLPTDAGRTLRVSLFDMGDISGSATATLQITPPAENMYSGGTVFSGCQFTLDGGTTSNTPSTCTVKNVNSNNGYQGKTLLIDVPIPTNYTCATTSATGCWIKVKAVYPSGVSDVTTWSAAILGNPIRLVE